MSELEGIVLGFDPGGKGNFGWSVCLTTGGKLLPPLMTGLASDAPEAIRGVQDAMKSFAYLGLEVLAAGIDAPMFWTRDGSRKVDDVIRAELKEKGFPPNKIGGTVQQVNSLQGACVAQGLLLADQLYGMYQLQITEAHPTASFYLLGQLKQDEEIKELTAGLTDHQFDATISAYAAWAMLKKFPGWRDIYQDEPGPVQPFGTPVSYWLPIP